MFCCVVQPLLCPPSWGVDVSGSSATPTCCTSPRHSSPPSPSSSSPAASSSSTFASSSSPLSVGEGTVEWGGEQGEAESLVRVFSAFRRQLASALLPASSPVAHLFRPLEELGFVSGLVETLQEPEDRPRNAPPSLATRVLVVYLHCWLAAFLHAFHADTVFAYCTCAPNGSPEQELHSPSSRLASSRETTPDARSFDVHQDESERFSASQARVREGDPPFPREARPRSKCRGCAAVTKRLHGTANWRRFLDRYFPIEVARFASVASAHQSAARALTASSTSSPLTPALPSSSLSSSSSSLSSPSSPSFSLLALPLRPQHQLGVGAEPLDPPREAALRQENGLPPEVGDRGEGDLSRPCIREDTREPLTRGERGLVAAEAAWCLLTPAKRFEERLELLHVRSRGLRGQEYKRFVEARTRQLLKKTLQSLLFRSAFAQLAGHVWGVGAKAKALGVAGGENEETTSQGREGASDGADAWDVRREKEGIDNEEEREKEDGKGRISGVLPGGQITQLFLFIVNDRLQTCAELALRCMYTRRERARQRREAKAGKDAADGAAEEGRTDEKDNDAPFSSWSFRQSREAQSALLPLSAVVQLWGQDEHEETREKQKGEEERADAMACAANLLFHCVDQPLFNVHGAFPLFSAACAAVDCSTKKKKRGRPPSSSGSSPSSPSAAREARVATRSAWPCVKSEETGSAVKERRAAFQGVREKDERESQARENDSAGSSTLPLAGARMRGDADEETEASARWSALVEAAVEFCVRREEDAPPLFSPPSSPSSPSACKREARGVKRGRRPTKHRLSSSDEEPEKQAERDGDKWRFPGIDLCGAFVAVRVQQLWKASQGQGDCREMVNQALREWRVAGAALASSAAPTDEHDENAGGGEGDACKEEKEDACSESISLLLSLHNQLRQMYEHMAAASRLTALLSLLRSSSPTLQQPRFLNLREVLEVNRLLQTQASRLSQKAALYQTRAPKGMKTTRKATEQGAREDSERGARKEKNEQGEGEKEGRGEAQNQEEGGVQNEADREENKTQRGGECSGEEGKRRRRGRFDAPDESREETRRGRRHEEADRAKPGRAQQSEGTHT
ncbi:conserved hypothetical protein [Neospora caninum Liverpool]|uniref:Uncharacterized protein n=1 Tax=Neospora caninum (strain Liverpool) TaxID=572307 RepID=F0VPT6_NEOCL|nr:conserved hypothetical protein [Neospora caninum Liverpool]CBZ55733.1 conserved hypothetical protein [Neospora caninum Liverpool]|eukprot:XP_003885759.1 conserved hypothetical protein [Neospora caninum Liverpool]